MMRRTIVSAGCALFGALGSHVAHAKGLDALSEQSPEATATQEAAESSAASAESSAASAESSAATTEVTEQQPVAPSELSKAVAQKLYLATSFGWVRATMSEGDWEESGAMSDLTIGYKVVVLSEKIPLAVTYRYAPIAVSGERENLSYRGIWEAHYVGSHVFWPVTQTLVALGSAEVGYVASHLNSVDGLGVKEDHEKGGASVALGGGADWSLLGGDNAFTIGPRLYAGFGSFTTFQLSAAASFLF